MRPVSERVRLGRYRSIGQFSVSIRAEKQREIGWVLHVTIYAKTPGGKRFFLAAEDFAAQDNSTLDDTRETAEDWARRKIEALGRELMQLSLEVQSGK